MPKSRTRRSRSRKYTSQRAMIKRMLVKRKAKRFHVVTTPASNVSSGGLLIALNQISGAQSGDPTERGSNEVQNYRLRLRYSVYPADDTNIVRVLVVWSQDSLVLADLPTNVLSFVGHTTMEEKGVYVIFDRILSMNLVASVGNGATQSFITKFIVKSFRLKGRKSEYSGINAGDIKTGFLYLFAISDSGIINHPIIEGESLLTFRS